MKIGYFSTTNTKGQIIIPKPLRDALGIDAHVTLNITLVGQGLFIHPVEEFVTKSERESSYLKLLEKTKGAWNKDSWGKFRLKKSTLELNASKARKNAW